MPSCAFLNSKRMIKDLIRDSSYVLSWGEVYYGLKRGYFDMNLIFNRNTFFSHIQCGIEERYVELVLEEGDAFEVPAKVKYFVYEDDGFEIAHNELSIVEDGDFKYVCRYRNFLDKCNELKFLIKIINANKSIREKFYSLYLHHSDVYYEEEWNKYIGFYFGREYLGFSEMEMYKKLVAYKDILYNEILHH